MRKSSFPILFLLLSLICCNQNPECNGIKNNQYSGYGIIFYHVPVSGSAYELIIVPICGDTSELKGMIQSNISKFKLLVGVNITIGSRRDSIFEKIFEKSQKIKLLNNRTLASEYKTIYACPVYIEFKDAQNNTQSITGSKQDKLNKKLVFENRQHLSLQYYLSDKLQVINIRVLSNGQVL